MKGRKALIPMPDTEKGRAYEEALTLIDKACSITEKYGRMTAQVLILQLVSRAIQQGISKKTVVQIVEETYDWLKGMQGMTPDQALKYIFRGE